MVVKQIDLQNTKLTLDELLSELDSDTEIILVRGNVHVARISTMPPQTETEKQPRVLGLHAGQGWMSDDFTAELPDSFWFGEDE